VTSLERSVLEAVLQNPGVPGAAAFDQLDADAFTAPSLRAVHEAIRAAGGVAAAAEPAGWLEAVREEAASTVEPLVAALVVTPLPEDRPEAIDGYVAGVVRRLVELGLTRKIADARGRLQRMSPDDEGYPGAFGELIELEGRRRALRTED
jgi:DNA primase